MNEVTITPTDNGPYLVQGGVTILDAERNEYEASDTIALCRCGHSRGGVSSVPRFEIWEDVEG